MFQGFRGRAIGDPIIVVLVQLLQALKQSYRDMLLIDERVRFVHLKGGYDLIKERLRARSDHYMDPGLLDSQFATLEEPGDVLQIDIGSSPDAIVGIIRQQLCI